MLRVLISMVCCAVWLFFTHTVLNLGGNRLPQISSFFSPHTGFWQNAYRLDNFKTKEFQNAGIQGSVIYDDRMVPHIFADNLSDAYFLQGYVHATLRLWQMDFSTRAAEGRISEIVGAKALEFDRIKRRKGFAQSASQSVETWKKFPESYKLCEAYAAGVNYYLDQMSDKDLPIEYKLMNFKPERWSPYKSSLFHKSMAEVLCGRETDVELSNAKLKFGNDFQFLFPEDPEVQDPVIPVGTKWNFSQDSILGMSGNSDDSFIGYLFQPKEYSSSGLGSNNWAVSAAKTQNKFPILCNDPHLTLTLPNIWFEQQIITPERNVYGVTFPGIPGIVIGFNEDIAWGVTNGGWDVLDWYSIKWKDQQKKEYLYDGKYIPVEIRIDTIKIAGSLPVYDSVKLTKWGPIVYSQSKDKKYDLAMKWVIQDKWNFCELDAFTGLNQARTYSDYRNAIKHFPYPAQNFAFASTKGDIAITVQGRMPIKSKEQGRFVSDGTDSKNNWKGYLESDFNPHTLNPQRGFISSANQKSTDSTFPLYYNDGDFREYRGQMVNRILALEDKWTVDKMIQMQMNNHSLKAESVLPVLLKCIGNYSSNPLIEKLKTWNYDYEKSMTQPVYFEIWFDYLMKLTWDEVYQDTLLRNTAVPSDLVTIKLLNKDSTSLYFDIKSTLEREKSCDIVRMAFDSMAYKIRLLNLEEMPWGKYKDAAIPHIAKIPSFGVEHLQTSGNADIINAHAKTFGPSWRMIVELRDTGPQAYGVYPGGQSGHPGSAYYTNLLEKWTLGEYYPLLYCKQKADLEGKIIFQTDFKN